MDNIIHTHNYKLITNDEYRPRVYTCLCGDEATEQEVFEYFEYIQSNLDEVEAIEMHGLLEMEIEGISL